MSDPVLGLARKFGLSGVRGVLRWARTPNFADSMIDRIQLKIAPQYRPISRRERRNLRRYLDTVDNYSEFIVASRQVSDAFVDSVESDVAGDHRGPTKRAFATELAELMRSELLAASSAQEAANILGDKLGQIGDDQRQLSERLELILEATSSRSVVLQPRTGELDEYQRLVTEAVSVRLAAIPFNQTFSASDYSKHQIGELPNLVDHRRRTALCGPAGAGKSETLLRTAASLNSTEGNFVVVLDMKKWQLRSAQDPTLDDLLSCSVVGLSIDLLERLSEQAVMQKGRLFWLVDGVNELGGQTSDQVVALLNSIMSGNVYSRTMVTDRSKHRYDEPDWTPLALDALTRGEALQVLERSISQGAAADLPDGATELLRNPFYLSLALEAGEWSLKDQASAIEGFLISRVALGRDALDALGAFAFQVYESNEGLSFDVRHLASSVGPEATANLIDSGIVVHAPQGQSHFSHQLLHDYLASRHVAGNRALWNPDGFDALSLEANADEAIVMVLEQLSNSTDSDQYVIAVYDWNWPAALRCIEHAGLAGQCSEELTLVLSAMVAEKRFDSVETSRLRAQARSGALDGITGRSYSELPTLDSLANQVIADAMSLQESPTWFSEWLSLFSALQDGEVAIRRPPEDAVENVAHANPLVGWTCAAVLRRRPLTTEHLARVRATYMTALRIDERQTRSIRWRAIHVLGAFPRAENRDFLIEVILKDPYIWSCYGAVRSLIELAAFSEHGLRQSAVDELQRVIPHIKPLPLSQVGSAICMEGALSGWSATIEPVLRQVIDLQHDNEEREKWIRRMEHFQTWSASR